MKKIILFYIIACIIAYIVGFWVGTVRADYEYAPPESPEDYGPIEISTDANTDYIALPTSHCSYCGKEIEYPAFIVDTGEGNKWVICTECFIKVFDYVLGPPIEKDESDYIK